MKEIALTEKECEKLLELLYQDVKDFYFTSQADKDLQDKLIKLLRRAREKEKGER